MKKLDLFGNETLPYAKGSDTSQEAAESMVPHVSGIRKMVLDFIAHCGKHGATCDDVERILKLSHQTASARICELKPAFIKDSGDRRKTRSGRPACVYVAVNAS